MPVAVGIDLAAGRGTTEVAALAFDDGGGGVSGRIDDANLAGIPDRYNIDGWRTPRFLREAYRATQSDDEIVEAACACAPLVIAIDAPLSLPAAVMAALVGATPTPDAADSRASPYTRAAERDPIWRRLGVRPLPVSFLGGLTFRALTLLPRLRTAAPNAAIIEVFPTATLAALDMRHETPTLTGAGDANASANQTANQSAAPKATPLAKTTPTRRAATQANLARWIAGLPTADADPLGADLLDALAAALTAVAYTGGRYQAIGDAAEGQIILPLTDISAVG